MLFMQLINNNSFTEQPYSPILKKSLEFDETDSEVIHELFHFDASTPISIDCLYHTYDNDCQLELNVPREQNTTPEPTLQTTTQKPILAVHPSMKNLNALLIKRNPENLSTLINFLQSIKPPNPKLSEKDKIGQDILQVAFEKCVNLLKNNSDHAQPFLKVKEIATSIH